MTAITAQFTCDIDPGIRTVTSDATYNQLIYADHSIEVTFESAGVAWPAPTGSTWEIVLIDREDPTGGVLARSHAMAPAPNSALNVFVFSISTNTVELRAYLAASRGKAVIVELVQTDPVVPQTYCRWQVTCWNQGYDPNSAVYAQLHHHTVCPPDRAPTADDDILDGYDLGSIWLWCSDHSAWLCVDGTAGAAVWHKWFDRIVPDAQVGTSVPAFAGSITMDDPSDMREGMALEVVQAANSQYYVVTSVGGGGIDVMGPPLQIGIQIDMIRWLDPPALLNMQVMRTCWDTGVDTALLRNIDMTGFTWEGPRSYIVGYRAMQMEVDATAQGTVHVRANNLRVSTTGVVLSTVGTWVDNGATAINPVTYGIDRGDPIELECSSAGVPGTGRFLTCKAVIVTEA